MLIIYDIRLSLSKYVQLRSFLLEPYGNSRTKKATWPGAFIVSFMTNTALLGVTNNEGHYSPLKYLLVLTPPGVIQQPALEVEQVIRTAFLISSRQTV